MVDLATKRVTRVIPLGAGMPRMWLSDGGKYLVAFQDGVSRHADNGQRASFVLLDANTNEPIRKY